MPTYPLTVLPWCFVAALTTGACAPVAEPPIPPAPIRLDLPDPAFEPAAQCHGTFALPDLERMLPQVRLALWLPATEAVELDSTRRCVVVTVQDTETGRFTALLLRGVGVPRHAVLLRLATPDSDVALQPPRGHGA
jgi:hypothetical protein